RALGWQVESVPWRTRGVPWDEFEAVVIRSPWDYQDDPEAFLDVLAEIERSQAELFNSLDLIRWNLSKTYLRDLEGRGVATVPTLWQDGLQSGDLDRIFDQVGADEIVLKPLISANADGAFRLNRQTPAERIAQAQAYYSRRPFLAQPFLRSVVDEGEFSLFYFNGEYSHCILKTPKPRDFRVQEEHGGDIRAAQPEQSLLSSAQQVLDALQSPPLYARADLVRCNADDNTPFRLMELELIEPSLYLRMDPDAPARFAQALNTRATH
ncbi:MAG TPA: hypothetical protein VLV83_20490, partial [Acidobacteriota bacterium]|nr:hypothetical protein [Acidobacteriota bacterium]